MKLSFNGSVMQEIYNELINRDIEYHLDLEDGVIEVEGFSKSGIAKIEEREDGRVFAHTRYNQVDELESFSDLVKLNFLWFEGYEDREPFCEPSMYWVDTLVEFGYLLVKETVVKSYKKIK